MKISDADSVFKVAQENELSFWSEDDYKNEAIRADTVTQIAEINGEIIGFIVMRLIICESRDYSNFKSNLNSATTDSETKNKLLGKNEGDIFNFAVKKDFQRLGIGSILLRNTLGLIDAGQTPFKMWLEVRESNMRAINFYRAHNFEVIYRRKNFYANPVEDALVMKLDL